jgi:hypothetical protein
VTLPVLAPAIWLTVDANILVGELLREWGRTLFAHPRLRILIAEYTWSEAQTYLPQRVRDMHIKDKSRSSTLLSAALAAATTATRRVPSRLYRRHEIEARDRIPRDPDIASGRR